MKKRLTIIITTALLIIIATVAFADGNAGEESLRRFNRESDFSSRIRGIQGIQSLDFIDLIRKLEPKCYEYGMKPNEFLDSTYKECLLYVNSCIDKETKMLKAQIVLFDSLGEKLISALGRSHD